MANTSGKPWGGSDSRRRRPFLNVKEAAQELRLDESTLYRHLREGRFPGVKVGGRYLVPAAVIGELADGAMAAGHCVDIEEWATRWRDERAAAADSGRRGPRSDLNPHGHVSGEALR